MPIQILFVAGDWTPYPSIISFIDSTYLETLVHSDFTCVTGFFIKSKTLPASVNILQIFFYLFDVSNNFQMELVYHNI